MKRKTLRAAVAAVVIFGTTAPLTQAATVGNDFTVAVTLSAQCQAVASGTQTLDFGTYTAFQGTAQAATAIDLVFECTRGLVPTSVDFDTTNGTAVGGGVIAGLNYALAAGAAVVTAGTAATSAVNDIGTADSRSYNITGSMPAGQAGEVGAAASHTRTLIVTY